MNKVQAPISKLSLERLLVDEIIFERKSDNNELKLRSKFSTNFLESKDNNKYKISLSVNIEDENKTDIKIFIKITGIFLYESDKNEDNNLKSKILQNNTIAILFPYLRSLVTNVTSQSGISPIVLPIINIAALMKHESECG